MIVVETLIERIHMLQIDEQQRERILKWVHKTAEEL
jgi:hypothetical protein